MKQVFTDKATGQQREFELVDGQWVPVDEALPAAASIETSPPPATGPGVGSNVLKNMLIGAAEEGSALGSGARQVALNFFGDEDSQEKARQDEQKRLEMFRQLYGEPGKPMMSTVGGIIPALMPVGGGLRAAGGAMKALKGANISERGATFAANLLGRAGGTGGGGAAAHAASSIAGGGVGGALQPTTEEGQREGNVLAGMAWGSAIPAISGISEGVRKVNRMLPDEAREDLVSQLGYPGSRASVSDELRRTLGSAKERVTKASNERYAALSDIAKNMPAQELRSTNDALSGIKDLATEINVEKNPALHRVLNKVKSVSDAKASQILGPNGQPLQLPPPTFSFDEIHNARKELRALQSNLWKSGRELDSDRVKKVIDNIDQDLTKFDPPVGPGVSNAAAQTRGMYRQHVVPFKDKKGELGKFMENPAADPSNLGRPEVTAQILRNAPEARVPLRALAGERVATNKSMRFGEALSQDELDYAERILRGERRPPPYVTKFIPGDWDERMFSGADPLGHRRRITNKLRTAGLSGAAGYYTNSEEDE